MERRRDEPAFPRDHRYEGHNGMTLRDYFAIHCDVPWGAAISGLEINGTARPTVIEVAEYRSKLRYIYADAMLAARAAA